MGFDTDNIQQRYSFRQTTTPVNAPDGAIWINPAGGVSGNNKERYLYDLSADSWDLLSSVGPDTPLRESVGASWRDTSIGRQNVYDGGSWQSIGVTAQGIISMWSGNISNIPDGWTLCDGTNGAPDLRNRFVTGAGDEYSVGSTGGEKYHQLTVNEMPSHSHTFADDGGSINNGKYSNGSSEAITSNTGSAGGNSSHENRPRFYAVAFIMKT